MENTRRDSPPSLLIEHIDDALQLPLINLIRLIPLPLLQSLSNTKNNLQTSLHSSLGLVRDELDGVPKHLPALGMADDDPRDLSVDELRRSNFAGESSVGGSVAVLGGDLDGGLDFFGGLEEVQGGRGDDDLYERSLNCGYQHQSYMRIFNKHYLVRILLTGLAVQLGLVHPLDQIRDALDAPVHLEVASDEELPGLVDHLDIYI
jgi:hypothetical protein